MGTQLKDVIYIILVSLPWLLRLTERLALELPLLPISHLSLFVPKSPPRSLVWGMAPLTVVWRKGNSQNRPRTKHGALGTARGQPVPTNVTVVYPMTINAPTVGKRNCMSTCGRLSIRSASGGQGVGRELNRELQPVPRLPQSVSAGCCEYPVQ